MARWGEMEHISIAIIGAGVAGLSAANIVKRSGRPYHVYEKSKTAGGISSSFKVDEFTFDYGIHGLYTEDKYVLDYLSNAVHTKHASRSLSIGDYFRGMWTRHPIYFRLIRRSSG